MDDMASVLFVVTIPTAAEEERLKNEFLAKQFDSKIEPTGGSTNFPQKVDSSSRTTITTSTSNVTPITTTLYKNNNDGQSINDNNAETISTTTIDATSITASNSGAEASNSLGTVQYSTLPKRKNSTQKSNILEELSDAIRNQDFTGTTSLKDVNIHNTVCIPQTNTHTPLISIHINIYRMT